MARLLVCLFAIVAVASTSAAASPLQPLGTAPASLLDTAPPVLATTRSGRAFVLEGRANAIAVRSARAGHRFGARRTLPGTAEASYPGLATARSGALAVGWLRGDKSAPAIPEDYVPECCDRVDALILDASGRRSRVRRLSAPGEDADPPVLVATSRRAAIAFADRTGIRVATANTRSTSGFRHAVRLSRSHDQVLSVWFAGRKPHVLVAARGRLVELYRRGRVMRRTHLVPDLPAGDALALARAADGRVAIGTTGRHSYIVIERTITGRVRVRRLPARYPVEMALGFAAHRTWAAYADGARTRVSDVFGRSRMSVGLQSVGLALAIDDRGRGVVASTTLGRRPRRVATLLGRGLRVQRRARLGYGTAYSLNTIAAVLSGAEARIVFAAGKQVAVRLSLRGR